jgi:methionine-gamma-lyase
MQFKKSITMVEESHPDDAIAQKQMRHPGALLSFELKGGLQAGKNFIDKLNMCVRAVSLGTLDTLSLTWKYY